MATNIIPRRTYSDRGYVSVGEVAANSIKDVAVTFAKPFASPPFVVAGLQSANGSYTMGQVAVSVHSVTANGFTIRVFNNRTAMSPAVYWIAIA